MASSSSDKIAIITDTHLGARNGSNVFRQLFREWYRDEFFPYIKANSITTILHGGDFFDNRNHLSLADIDYVVGEFIPLLEDSGATMNIIAGNHDTFYRNTNAINALRVLQFSENVRVIYDHIEVIETAGRSIVMLPWLNESTDHLLPELAQYANDDHILLAHLEIVGAKMYKNSKVCEHGQDADLFKGFNQVWSGHFHHPSKFGSNIEYLGAAFHFNWQDHDDWRGFRVYDSETNQLESIENPYCLFSALDYEDARQMSDSDLKDVTEGQYVRIYINDEYKKVQRQELVKRIESNRPVSVDIIDNVAISQVIDSTEQSKQNNPDNKTIRDYAEEYIERGSDPERLSVLFNIVYDTALSQRTEVE